MTRIRIIFSFLACVSGCASISDVTKPPKFSQPVIANYASPVLGDPRVRDPNASHLRHSATPGSLWRSGPESLFGDRRARRVGDILTIVVEIDDAAEIRNRTERKRNGADRINVPALLGAEGAALRALGGSGLDPAVSVSSSASSTGDGTIRRADRVTLRIAATVVDVMPNGHLAIAGSQQVRVNYELRDLEVSGVVRPEDISRVNTITYEKIADARIHYGGRGQISDFQRARYGQKILDILSPF